MAHATKQGPQLLNGFKRVTRFEKGLGAQLPEAYKKFWREWKVQQPAAVHYIPKEGQWERDEVTGEIKPIQNIPLPLIDTPESHKGIWGGEAVIKGFQKRERLKRRVPHFWVPVLRRSVVHSQVLNEYMSMVVTDRTIEKIHECHGFDHYLLKHPACDLRSSLALTLKRKILQELLLGCPAYSAQPAERERILNEYKCYLEGYTPEEIEWYGYTYDDALKKLQAQLRAENPVVPHKVEFRMKLIEQLKQAGIREASGSAAESSDKPNEPTTKSSDKDADIEALTKLETSSSSSTSSNWLSKINPFGKKQET
ncbi:39S ribosomal protein L28, mitochondrial [Lucilia cuprina]|uniref:39S ribosomal protein L28, mitochondrial n=1 Tax=Lucilia cuprina TaxID=7375 RepID=A0A0L0BT61_LUCCU|nr:mitochondrial, 39S ribosomal protein L28 [Lucilia cuprina]KNC23183.1 39S ribosomal protein L28, mitochondrial [Lucilia cuprina]